MSESFSSADVGKRVMTKCGHVVGTVKTVDSDGPYVEPDPSLPTGARERLGWVRAADVYRLDPVTVETITEETVRIRPEFWPDE